MSRWRAPAGLAAGAAAAALLLLTIRSVAPPERTSSGPIVTTKGGDVAVTLVSSRKGRITDGAPTFRADDGWKALVTCPAPLRLFADVVVFQDGETTFPGALAPLVCEKE